MKIINFNGYTFILSNFVPYYVLSVYIKDVSTKINDSYLEYLKKIIC